MKPVLSLAIALLTFLGITGAATPDPKAPQILIQAKFIEISSQGRSGGAPLPAPFDVAGKVPGLVGTLTDPQFQTLIRGLAQRKGVDLMSAPLVTVKAGQQAKVEVVREFVYPDEVDKQITKNVGVTLAVLPKMTADDRFNLDLSPQVVEFDGFVKSKSGSEQPIFSRKILHTDGTSTESTSDMEKGELRESTFDVRGKLLSKTTVPSLKAGENAYGKPVFNERKATMSAVMTTGQTTVLEMDPRIDQQVVHETDAAGRVISSVTDVYTRRTLVFVTAYLIDPATGKPRVP